MMLGTVFLLGYRDEGAWEWAGALVGKGVWLLDIRCAPVSPGCPAWSRSSLQKHFGACYLWVSALGNRHYRTPSQPIVLVNEAAGIAQVTALLQSGQSLCLLCACRAGTHCHRYVVADLLKARLPTIQVHDVVGGESIQRETNV